jgi:hypothetical protein
MHRVLVVPWSMAATKSVPDPAIVPANHARPDSARTAGTG